MYQNDLIERLRNGLLGRGNGAVLRRISPTVWALGLTSFLTDISSEMVNSILPVYLFIHLRLSPLQFGAIDGVYSGLSMALVALMVGVGADRWRRHKEAAVAGYGLSAICKLLLISAGSAWGWIMAVVGVDRLGKGIRTAPRDAMISLSTSPQSLALAFGVHRALDSGGALLGPIVAFLFLAQLGSNHFNSLWLASFLIAVMGVAALWLFVPGNGEARRAPEDRATQATSSAATRIFSSRFLGLAICGILLAAVTISDGFLYLLIRERTEIDAGYLPLFYVVTASTFMIFAMPAGYVADSYGRKRVFASGYTVLIAIYAALLFSAHLPKELQLASLIALGIYYAATEGVLMALASAIVPGTSRATGLALLMTAIGLGKFASSLTFGWLWQRHGTEVALTVYLIAAAVVCLGCFGWLARWRDA